MLDFLQLFTRLFVKMHENLARDFSCKNSIIKVHFFYNLLSKKVVVQGKEAGFQRAAATSWMGRVVLVCEEKLSYELNGILVHPILKNHIF